jgi:cytidyltransferase-like protein
MPFNFYNVYESLLKEIQLRKIGIFPGKFKPPHKGHYRTCEVASKENDIVLVLISSKEHESYTGEQSFNIWNIYKKYLPNIIPFIATPTPVLATYDLANIFNNGEFIPQSINPRSNILELINNSKEVSSYINVGNNIELNLYSSPEDQERYKRMKSEIYIGKTVLDINFKEVDRLTSATKFREAIRTNNNIESFLPSRLDQDDVVNILNILR